MEALKAWIEDRKNLPIVAAGTSIIIILALLIVLKSNGVIGGKKQAPADMSAQNPSMPMAPPVMPPGAPGVQPTAPVAPPPGTQIPGGETAAQTQTVAVPAKLAPMLPYRKDPFSSLTGYSRVKEMLVNALPMIESRRLAPASVSKLETIQEEALPPQPFRRMAGVLWNGKVAAIMETNGESDIVRPGMEITKGNSRVLVESIQPNCIILKTLDTMTPMTIKVNMAGSVTSGGSSAAPQGYNAPGMPLGYPGGPMPMGGPIQPT